MGTKVEVRTIPLHGLFIHSKQVWRSLGKLRAESHSTTAQKVFMNEHDTEVSTENAASLWHDLKEEKPPLKKWVMFRYSGRGVNPTALHYGAMSDDIWVVTRGDGTQRIEVLYECYDKIEWFDFDELK